MLFSMQLRVKIMTNECALLMKKKKKKKIWKPCLSHLRNKCAELILITEEDLQNQKKDTL